jgi:hypothetical protein
MCTQCCVDAQFFLLNPDGSVDDYKDLLPGWALFRATRDGAAMKAGQWGLVQCNDPDFVWDDAPIPDPCHGLSDDEYENELKNKEVSELDREFIDRAQRFDRKLVESTAAVDSVWRLVESGRKMGYDPDTGGTFAYWLFHRMGVWVRDHQPISHVDERLN